jgi:1-acyl-sn-glycerol-3-phosphate acyltransferase
MKFQLTGKDIFAVNFQKIVDHILFPFSGYAVLFLIFIFGRMKIHRLEEHRKLFRELIKDRRPLMICSNHLTFIDSVIIIIATSSVFRLMLSFRTMSWNIPAVEHYRGSLFLQVFSWLGKCIPIDRNGTPGHMNKVLEKMKYLLYHGNIVTIFPEGRRSRTGRVDPESVTYGVGNILKDLPGARVLCIYMRGDHQKTFSKFPAIGETFYLKTEVMEPKSENRGLRAARDISLQVIKKIKEMEDHYFANYTGRKF